METQQFVEEIEFNELSFSEVVGRGAFGVVHRALWRGANVAVKLIETESERKAFITELKQLSRISHPNIVRLYGACTKQPVCLVMEFAEGGSLYNVLHCTGLQLIYTAAHALSWALQCARGVEYLHGMKPKPLIHRDLKPPNLLLVNGGTTVKICDFGTACDAHTHMTNNKGSAAWMAPEVFEGCNYSEKCDVFSWGIILWEVVTRHKPFEEIGGSAFRVMWAVHSGLLWEVINRHKPFEEIGSSAFCVMWAVHSGKRPPLVRNIPKPLQTLMTRCWSAAPTERPSMSEVVRVMSRLSQFFKGETEPLCYPPRADLDESVHRDHTYITSGNIVPGLAIDSRNSTVRETMCLGEIASDGDVVRRMTSVVPLRKPLILEENPFSIQVHHGNQIDLNKPLPDKPLENPVSAEFGSATEPPKPPMRKHRRTGSQGAQQVLASQPPFVPGHRRTGSHGNVPVAPPTAEVARVDGAMLHRMTTAPGNLDDGRNRFVPPNGNAFPGVSSVAEQYAGDGSTEDLPETFMNKIDPQLRPLPPCSTSRESVEIYNCHIQLLNDYLQLEAAIARFEEEKTQLIIELQIDEKEHLNRMKQDYTNLLTENDQLKLLYRNLRTQVEQINQCNSTPTSDPWRSGSR